jgi:hypothetical protein
MAALLEEKSNLIRRLMAVEEELEADEQGALKKRGKQNK